MDYELQNTIYLMGYLAGDPTHNKTNRKETPVTSFTIAVSRGYRDKETGNNVADFIRCVAWRNLAVWSGETLEKGDFIAVKGKLRISKWISKETGEQRQGPEIRLSEVKILRKKNYVPRQDGRQSAMEENSAAEELDIIDGIETADVSLGEM